MFHPTSISIDRYGGHLAVTVPWSGPSRVGMVAGWQVRTRRGQRRSAQVSISPGQRQYQQLSTCTRKQVTDINVYVYVRFENFCSAQRPGPALTHETDTSDNQEGSGKGEIRTGRQLQSQRHLPDAGTLKLQTLLLFNALEGRGAARSGRKHRIRNPKVGVMIQKIHMHVAGGRSMGTYPGSYDLRAALWCCP
jgi:hypothetical protein